MYLSVCVVEIQLCEVVCVLFPNLASGPLSFVHAVPRGPEAAGPATLSPHVLRHTRTRECTP